MDQESARLLQPCFKAGLDPLDFRITVPSTNPRKNEMARDISCLHAILLKFHLIWFVFLITLSKFVFLAHVWWCWGQKMNLWGQKDRFLKKQVRWPLSPCCAVATKPGKLSLCCLSLSSLTLPWICQGSHVAESWQRFIDPVCDKVASQGSQFVGDGLLSDFQWLEPPL
jgi:hypothetical protein